eukprot:IDg11218t1
MPSNIPNGARTPSSKSAKKRKRSKAFRARTKVRKIAILDEPENVHSDSPALENEPIVQADEDASADTGHTAPDSAEDDDYPNDDAPLDSSAKSVAELEAELSRDGVRAANVALELVSRVKPGRDECVTAMHAARRSLAKLAPAAKTDHTIAAWVDERRSALNTALVTVVGDENSSDAESESALAVCALVGGNTWAAGVAAALLAKSEHPSSLLSESFVVQFLDLRIVALQVLASQDNVPASRALALLNHCVQPPEKTSVRNSKAPSKAATSQLPAAYGAAWLRVLGSGLPSEQLAAALQRLSVDVLPKVEVPLSFADLLTRCYNDSVNSNIAISALDGLFLLISKHGLDYPLFYQKLYALFTPEVLFYSEQNARFLDLASKFLRF